MKFSFLLINVSCLFYAVALHSSEVVEETPPLVSEEIPLATTPLAVHEELMKMSSTEGYTINYNTLSIIEYIRFASKISGVNFIFDEADLNFNITVVSDEPITSKNVMATLVQVLRIHGLTLLEQDNNLVIHKNSDVKQIANLVVGRESSHNSPIVTRIFRIKMMKPESVASIIRPFISKEAVLDVSPETKQIILTDVTVNVDKVALLIENLDAPYANIETKTYETRHNAAEFLIGLANQILEPVIHGSPFVMVPQPHSHTIYIVSTPELNEKARAVLKRLDTPPKKREGARQGFKADNVFVYKIEHASGERVLQGLKDIASSLKHAGVLDYDLIEALHQAKLIEETNSVIFVASKDSIDKIKEFLPALDSIAQGAAGVKGGQEQFLIYTPRHQTAEHLIGAIKEMEKNLESSHLTDKGLLYSLKGAKWVPATHLLLFTGDPASLKKVEDLLATLDVPSASMQKSSYYVYKLQNTTTGLIEQSMKSLAANLKGSGAADPKLLHALEGLQYIAGTNSVLITGNPDAIEEVKKLIADYDVATQAGAAPGYFLYRLQNTTGDLVEEDLERLAKDLKQSGMVDNKLIHVIDTMRYVKETNSILLTGDPRAIEEAKDLLAKYDYPRPTAAIPSIDHFFLYKPQYLDAVRIQKSLRDIGENLKKSQLADSSFLSTIESMKYVESTNSLIFTGTQDALQKIQTLIKDIDVASSQKTIQHLGKTSFFLYKLQHASGEQMVSAIGKIATDLKKSGTTDTDFVTALSSMRYIQETNSLMFTGSEEALSKVQKLVEKFDVADICGTETVASGGVCCAGPAQFFLYTVQYLAGPDLIKLLEEFAENVKSGGLCDPDLFNSISSARWVEKTRSLVFTGSQKSLDQVKDLLKNFDMPNRLEPGELGENPIEGIDNTSFLVYKLQFHKGDEIQGALRQIAKDLAGASVAVNQNLLNAINSIQWIEMTNSLLSSGDQETLTRLRDLIKSLDVPLKQVFIEMLVIETSLANSLTFGLEWGGKYKYRNKFSGSINNLIPGSGSTTPDTFSQGLNNINPSGTMPINPSSTGTSTGSTTTIPSPQLIPFAANGFDLGIIGEVIRHKGQTFLTLGSLLNALQQDVETSIVMNPKLITQDSKTSSIFIGQNIPFTGSFVSNMQANTVNTTNIEYRDIGMSLTITPVLGNSDVVTLDIAFDQSSTVTAQSNQVVINSNGTTTLEGITTTKNTMQTTVHVPDDNFLILSGMVNSTRSKTVTGLPCLGGLPLIGAAFSTDVTVNDDTNVVIFIRPHILNSLEDMRKISRAQEEFFRDQAGSPMLEHNFEEGMEMIKTVDDE